MQPKSSFRFAFNARVSPDREKVWSRPPRGPRGGEGRAVVPGRRHKHNLVLTHGLAGYLDGSFSSFAVFGVLGERARKEKKASYFVK